MNNTYINPTTLKKEKRYISYERSREIISLFQKNKAQFKELEYWARNHSIVALYAYRMDKHNIQYIWDDLKKDANFVHKAIKWNIFELVKLKPYIDKNIIYDLVKIDINYIKLVSLEKLSNKETMLKFIEANELAFKVIPKNLQTYEFVKEAIKANYKIYFNFSEKDKRNKELLIIALNTIDEDQLFFEKRDNTWLYNAIPDELKNDEEIKAIIAEKTSDKYFF